MYHHLHQNKLFQNVVYPVSHDGAVCRAQRLCIISLHMQHLDLCIYIYIYICVQSNN